MRRRELLGAAGGASLGGFAGCLGLFEQRTLRAPPVVEDRPAAVYVPTHEEGMDMAGMTASGPYECVLAYTFPHRFWLVTGTRRERVDIRKEDSVHLMPVVWDAETGIVPPDVNPQVAIERDGESVAQFAPWPMLSQPMGFHFGDNVALDGTGTYDVTVSIGSPSIRRTGSLANNEGAASFEFDFEFERSRLEEISFRDIPPDEEGERGAVDPRGMEMLPSTQLPAESDLPGTVRASGTSGDARFLATTLSDATPYGGSEDETYLAVSPRTPYNRYPLSMMSVSATLTRGGETVFDDALAATLDPDLGYHYGAAVSGIADGDELVVDVGAPPQTARHEGYETAFLEMDDLTLAL